VDPSAAAVGTDQDTTGELNWLVQDPRAKRAKKVLGLVWVIFHLLCRS